MNVDLFGVLHGQQAFIPTMLERALERGTEAVVVNTASAAGLSNTAYTPNGTTDMAYTVAKNGVTLLSESLSASMRSRDAPISVHVLCPYGTQSSMGLNSAKFFNEFKSDSAKASQEKQIAAAERRVAKNLDDPGSGGQITAERSATHASTCKHMQHMLACVLPQLATPEVTQSLSRDLSRDLRRDIWVAYIQQRCLRHPQFDPWEQLSGRDCLSVCVFVFVVSSGARMLQECIEVCPCYPTLEHSNRHHTNSY